MAIAHHRFLFMLTATPISSAALRPRHSCANLRFLWSSRASLRAVRSGEPESPVVDVAADDAVDEYMNKRLQGSNQQGDGEEEEVLGEMEEVEGVSFTKLFGGEEEADFDRDPELGDILGTFVTDPKKGQARVEDRIRKKRNKILHPKTGSPSPMSVVFNKFEFSNSYIWFEFYHAPLPNYVAMICDTIRSWHIVGRLGGCNSMNMQLSQAPLDTKRPSYDAIQGANVSPTLFYNIGDLELQDNLARIWVDIGTPEPLLLDVLINALATISSDHVGIKQVVFGGEEFGNWKDDMKSEEAGYSNHKI